MILILRTSAIGLRVSCYETAMAISKLDDGWLKIREQYQKYPKRFRPRSDFAGKLYSAGYIDFKTANDIIG